MQADKPPNGKLAGESKKKKKKAPDRPQPEWLFPADEDNPALNPKPASEEKAQREKDDWDGAVKALQYKVVTAPMKAPPPGMLLTLVGAFLSTYNFDPAARLFSTHVAARARLDEWKTELGVKLPKDCPDLVKIFQQWHTEWDATRSHEDDNEKEKPNRSKTSYASKAAANEISEAISSSDGGNSRDEEDSGSDSDSDLDSDSDSDSDVPTKTVPKSQPKNRKRKLGSSPKSDSSASGGSSAIEGLPLAKKPKIPKYTASIVQPNGKEATKPTKRESTNKASAPPQRLLSTDSSASDSERDHRATESSAKTTKSEKKVLKPKNSGSNSKIKVTKDNSKSSDSSTLEGSPVKEDMDTTSSMSSITSSSSESASSTSTPPVQETKAKKSDKKRKRSKSPKPESDTAAASKVIKTQNVPFQRISKDTVVEPKLASNAYVPYDYADRAHRDLIVTKGKGFTKEKNKKKRGSYRGGQIDVEGKKGIKFDD